MKPEQNTIPQQAEKNIIEPQLNFILTTDEDDERPVYISGNFNLWVTQDKKFQMEKVGKGLYHFKFPNDFNYPDELLYKFTRGDWSEVEIDKYGNRTENVRVNNTMALKKNTLLNGDIIGCLLNLIFYQKCI
jgi:hypothetical protein